MSNNQTKPGAMVLVETFRDSLLRNKQPSFSRGDLKFFIEELTRISEIAEQPPAVGGEPDRDQFENEYRKEFATVRGYAISAEEMESMRDGDFYGSDRAFLNGQWAGWQKNHRAHVAPLLAEKHELRTALKVANTHTKQVIAKLNAALARIAELEAGQRKPVAWVDPSVLEFLAVRNTTDRTEWRLNMATHQLEESYVALYRQAQPATAKVVLSFDFKHPSTNEQRNVTLTKKEVLEGMEDYFYEKISEQLCSCEAVGETSVIDCNCDEYVHDFEIVNSCLDELTKLNGGA